MDNASSLASRFCRLKTADQLKEVLSDIEIPDEA